MVTLWYRAPEVLLSSGNYSYPIDIWAWACIFVEMCAKKPLFTGDDEVSLLQEIYRVLGTPTQNYWPDSGSSFNFQVQPTFEKRDVSPRLAGFSKIAVDLAEVLKINYLFLFFDSSFLFFSSFFFPHAIESVTIPS